MLMAIARLPLFFVMKTARTATKQTNSAVFSLAGAVVAQDFCGTRDIARCKFVAKTAKNSEVDRCENQGMKRAGIARCNGPARAFSYTPLVRLSKLYRGFWPYSRT
jgi:hypothetical protein